MKNYYRFLVLGFSTIGLLFFLSACGDNKQANSASPHTQSKGSKPALNPPQVSPDPTVPPEIQISRNRSGQPVASFTRITDPQILAALGGEAWQLGTLIWGNLATDENSRALVLTHEAATQYCAARDSRLPNLLEFRQLKVALGGCADLVEGAVDLDYVPQILPNLLGMPEPYHTSTANARWLHSPGANAYYLFDGTTGSYYQSPRELNGVVRCVRTAAI